MAPHLFFSGVYDKGAHMEKREWGDEMGGKWLAPLGDGAVVVRAKMRFNQKHVFRDCGVQADAWVESAIPHVALRSGVDLRRYLAWRMDRL